MDKNMLGDLDALPEEDKIRMTAIIDQLQSGTDVSLIASTLDKQEETCVRRCAQKFLKHSMRAGMRFSELNQGAATQD